MLFRFLWIFAALGALAIFTPQRAMAASRPDCGKVSRSTQKDVYAAANRASYFIDAESVLDSFCEKAEDLRLWEKEHDKERRTREYKKARKAILKEAEKDMRGLQGQLLGMWGWGAYDAHDTLDEVLRRSKFKKARERAETILERIDQYAGQIEALMKSYESAAEEPVQAPAEQSEQAVPEE